MNCNLYKLTIEKSGGIKYNYSYRNITCILGGQKMRLKKTAAGILAAAVTIASLSALPSAGAESSVMSEISGTAVFAADPDGYVDGTVYTFSTDEYEFDKNTVVTATVNAADGDEPEYTVTIVPDGEVIGDSDTPEDPYETEDEPGPEDSFESVAIAVAGTGTTKVDPDGFVRTTIINTFDSNPADTIADGSHFKGAELISVRFTVTDFTQPFKAWLMLADTEAEIFFSYLDDSGNAEADSIPVEVTDNGTYVVYIMLDKPVEELNYLAVATDIKPDEGDAFPTIAIDSILINDIFTIDLGESNIYEEIIIDEPPVRPEDKNPDEDPGTNPPTGIALTIIPAALAACALAVTCVTLKKRSR